MRNRYRHTIEGERAESKPSPTYPHCGICYAEMTPMVRIEESANIISSLATLSVSRFSLWSEARIFIAGDQIT